MARYFFHIRNRIGLVRDEEGVELATLEAARDQAIQGIRSIIGDEARDGLLDLRGALCIADSDGRTLLVLPFREAFEAHLEAESGS